MKICGAKTRSGSNCQKQTGWGTDHFGKGRCRLHGGNAGRPVIHGRYALKHHASIAEKKRQFLEEQNPANLAEELALMRALLSDYLDRWQAEIPGDEMSRIFDFIESISKLVERISKMINETALTQVELGIFQEAFVNVLCEFIPDETEQIRAVERLQSRIPGGL